jgi:energy-coupling factor transport system ATP-binding protein
MSFIEIRDLNFKYEDKVIFKDLTLNINKGSWTTIIGKNGVGKTTLSKILSTLILTDSYYIEGNKIDKLSVNKIRRKIGVVFENPSSYFVCEHVRDEIVFGLENLKIPRIRQNNKLEEITSLLDIEHLLNKKTDELSGGEKELVSLASVLVMEPEILILDEALSMESGINKTKTYKLLTKLQKEKDLTVINITHDVEDMLLGDEVIILGDNKIITSGKSKEVSEDVKSLKEAGYEPPFIVDLSLKLQYYGLVDKVYYNMNKLVNDLWQ